MLTRRHLLGLAGGLVVTGLAGCSLSPDGSDDDPTAPRPQASCVPRSALESHREIAGLPLVYEISEQPMDFWFEPGFYGQLGEWAGALADSLGTQPDQLRTYGSWIAGSGECGSWHNAGRAFDLAGVRLAGGQLVSCRYDRWLGETGAALDRRLQAYWRLAASLHLRFSSVLTYLYDTRHHNHIHVDNGRSGAEWSTFSSRSRVQVQAVQAIASYLWGRPVSITGRWDLPTRSTVEAILDELGLPHSLTEPESWRGLLAAASSRRPD